MLDIEHWKIETRVPKPLRYELPRASLVNRILHTPGIKLVALFAPSGYGKTTLLGQVVRTGKPTAWLRLNPEMVNPMVLARAMVYSICGQWPQFDLEKMDRIQETASSIEQIAYLLARELALLDQEILIVIDQIQHLSAASCRWLERFLEYLPEGHIVVISGYKAGHFQVSKYFSKEKAILLTAEQVAFDQEETSQYLKARQILLDEDVLHKLEGWPAGLALASSDTANYISPKQLVIDMINQLPYEIRQIIPALSVLKIWSQTEIRQLGINYPPNCLEMMCQMGLPIYVVGMEEYKPHGLLREVLYDELLDDEEMSFDVHLKIGKKREEAGYKSEALDIYMRGGLRKDAIRLAHILMSEANYRCEHQLCFDVWNKIKGLDLPDVLTSLFMLSCKQMGAQIDMEFITQLSGKDCIEPESANLLAGVFLLQGDTKKALEYVDLGLKNPKSYHFDWSIRLKMSRAWALNKDGKIDEAWKTMREIVEQAEELREDYLIPVLMEAAELAAEIGEIEESRHLYQVIVRESIKYLRYSDAIYAAKCLVDSYIILGEFDKALEICVEMKRNECCVEDEYLLVFQEIEGDILFWAGDFKKAYTHWANLAQWISDRLVQQKCWDSATVARLQVKMMDAEMKLGKIMTSEIEMDQVVEEELDFLNASIQCVNGNIERSMILLNKIINGGLDSLYVFRSECLMMQICLMRDLECGSIVEKIERRLKNTESDALIEMDAEYIERSDRKITDSQIVRKGLSSKSDAVLLVDDLSSRLEITINGNLVNISHKRVRELFFALAMRGGGGVSRDELVGYLWNGDVCQKNIRYFKVLVRRLRQMIYDAVYLDFNPVVYDNKLYQLSDLFDIQMVSDQLRQALNIDDQVYIQEMLQHYSDDGLKDFESEWIAQRVQENRFVVKESLLYIEEHAIESDKKIWALHKMIELDSFDETAHLKLIQLLKRDKYESMAKLAYDRYSKILKEELGIFKMVEYSRLI